MKRFDVVAGVILQEGNILCVQKAQSKREYISLKWEFPGGKVEQGEECVKALEREIGEELHLGIGNVEFLITVEHTYPDFHLVMHAYTCAISSGEPVLTEHVDLKWLSVYELDQLDWAAADIPIVEKLMSGRG